jgi:hypothetical protein
VLWDGAFQMFLSLMLSVLTSLEFGPEFAVHLQFTSLVLRSMRGCCCLLCFSWTLLRFQFAQMYLFAVSSS